MVVKILDAGVIEEERGQARLQVVYEIMATYSSSGRPMPASGTVSTVWTAPQRLVAELAEAGGASLGAAVRRAVTRSYHIR